MHHLFFDSDFAAAATPGAMVVAWSDNTPGNHEIYVKTSADNGATWTAAKRIAKNAGESFWPIVSVNGADIHMVWYDNTPGNFEIFYKRSADSGVTWSAAKRLTYNSGDSYRPSMAVSGTNIHIVWYEYASGNLEIFYKRSTDSGVTWSAAKRLTNNAGNSVLPAIAVSGTNIYVAWQDNTSGNSEICLKTSDDNGERWSAVKRITTNRVASVIEPWAPALAVSGPTAYVMWNDASSGNYELYYKTSSDTGATWSAAKRLTNNAGWSEGVSVAVSGTNVHMAWNDDTPGSRREIYFKTSSDDGATWSAAKRLTNNTGDSAYPSIAR